MVILQNVGSFLRPCQIMPYTVHLTRIKLLLGENILFITAGSLLYRVSLY